MLAVWLCLCAIAIQGLRLDAQEAPQFLSPWAEWPGVFDRTPDGPPSGLYGELTQAIAQRAGLDVQFVEYDTLPEAIGAWRGSGPKFLAGPPRTQALSANLFSDPIGQAVTYLFVLDPETRQITLDDMTGSRIGVVERAAGSEYGDLGGRAGEVVPFSDLRDALGALVTGQVDGLVTTYKFATDLLRRTRLDSRVRPVNPSLQTEDFYAILSPGHEELLPRINAAIAEMRADGSLDEILRRWDVTRPSDPPDVLTVGVSPFPPYQVVTQSGEFTGYGVEALRDVAERAGLELRFIEITADEWAAGPRDGTYDMLPPLSITQEKRRQMDFTLPVQTSPYSIFTRAGEGDGIGGMADLAGMRVGLTRNSWANSLVGPDPGFELVLVDDEQALLRALLQGEVDAVIYATATFERAAAAMDASESFDEIRPPVAESQRAIGLRSGLPTLRERLNAVIPGYLSSEEYQTLNRQWLGPPTFWTDRRVLVAKVVGILSALAIAAAFLIQTLRARRRAEVLAGQTRAVSDRLRAVLNANQNGIAGIAKDGRIVVANHGARAILGLGSQDLPLEWPSATYFLSVDSQTPLAAADDPVRRALAGEKLMGETMLMRRDNDRAPIYVRVSSAPVASSSGIEVSAVLVVEDVTQQERNRQQVERSARLDALGQLTGGVAHDFNNILATIENAIVLAKGDVETRDGYLDIALSSIRRGAGLTRHLLTFARQQPGVAASVPLSKVIKEFRELTEPAIQKDIEVVFEIEDAEIDGKEIYVYCDVGQLENALLNLVVNSRDAIRQSGIGDRITIRVRGVPEREADDPLVRVGDAAVSEALKIERVQKLTSGRGEISRFVEFAISDNGPGMTDETRRRATDPFFTTKQADGGSGLGLSMVYGFVQQAQGEMRIYSELAKGTTVRLLVPRGDRFNKRESPRKRGEPVRGKGERVLLVEDNEELLRLSNDVLKMLGYDVVQAATGKEALEKLDSGVAVDLLLTDIVMPGGIGGYELARQVRKRFPHMPVLYRSGYAGYTKQDMGDVVAPVLGKPTGVLELSEALRSALDA
ncbi:transporter substrate-binding domain-containing protein [Sulfitobacter sp. LCG007]